MRNNAILATLLFVCLAVTVTAADFLPNPPAGLEGTREAVTQKILDSKNEDFLCGIIKLEGDSQDIDYVKMLASKRLAVYGTEKSVPVLVPMLAAGDMGMYARFAMEPMPNKAVDAAFREATKTLKGQNLVGLLSSIGVRRDTEAVPFLKPLLESEDEAVVKATYGAFGYIGTPECAEILTAALKTLSPESTYEKAICDAACNCAEHLAKAGKLDVALDLYDTVIDADVRPFHKEGAIYNRILVQGDKGLNDLVKYLKSEDKGIFEAALQTVRLLPSENTYQKVKELIPNLPEDRSGLVFEALAGIKDKTTRKAVLADANAAIQSKTQPSEVYLVSVMNALGALDGPGAVPGLLHGVHTNNGEGPVAEAAFRALIFMKDKGVDEEIAKKVAESGDKLDSVTIRLAKERRIAGITPQLLKIVEEKDSPLRTEAIDALGETATLNELAAVANLLTSVTKEEEKKQILIALSAICSRMPQKEGFDTVLDISEKNANRDVRFAMIDLLKTIGGKDAVDATLKMALGNRADLADKATQVLGTWDSPDTMEEIAAALLKVAKESKEERFKTRGIRGYIRLARQFNYPEDQRIEMIKTAFDTATRPEDKALVFDIFARNPSITMMENAVSYTSEPEYKERACAAAVATAAKLQGRSTRIADAMKKVIEQTKDAETKAKAQSIFNKMNSDSDNLQIIKAVYG
ncbi:MAG: hypothetical protein ACRC2T_05355, partial [Thermoguttaceae bacterium]